MICFSNNITELYNKRKCKESYNFTKLQEKIKYLLNIDDYKIFTKNAKELETLYKLYVIIYFVQMPLGKA